MIGVTVLGATGSVGLNTLEVLARHPDRYRVAALTAHKDVSGLLQLCERFQPEFAVMADQGAAAEIERLLEGRGLPVKVLAGHRGLETVASLPQVGLVMAAIVGAAGLAPTLAAARSGKKVLLANKEALVIAGQFFMDAVRTHGAVLLPIDSEHNAIFQCLPPDFHRGLSRIGVQKIVLTSSGGPFRTTPLAELRDVTPQQACAHPNWMMGKKISVDSATMMNKGLEVIEASWLFGATPDMIDVVVHPQSIVHSLVEYVDGSLLAQLGTPDMRIPIAHALAWPERIASGAERLDLVAVSRLEFEEPDLERFPCLGYAYQAIRAGGTAAAILNASNEVAVEAFLQGRIRFTDIAATIAQCLEDVPARTPQTLEQVLDDDQRARQAAARFIRRSEFQKS